MFVKIIDNIKMGVVVFIILLFIFGCMSLKTHINTVYEKPKYVKDYRIGSENFVFLVKEVQPVLCFEGECPSIVESTASGLVFSSDNNSIFVLTAAHFCEQDPESSLFFIQTIYGFAGDIPRELHPLYMDLDKDLCMLFGLKDESENYSNIKIAKETIIGEDVYTVAAPDGIAGPGKRPIFTGKMAGCDKDICMTTLPATFGSSGAGIYNSKNELISIVMAVPQEFNHVVISPSREDVIKFIQIIDESVDIYSYK